MYFTVYRYLNKVPHPTNAMDVEFVVDCFRLAIEVTSPEPDHDITYVDAYSGAVIERIPHPGTIRD